MTKLPILKILITISVYCCVFANGICSNIYSPTWLDLKSLMNTTLEKMSISISLRAAFFCAGAIIGGFIYKLIDRGALYPLFILTKGLCVALIPLYANYRAFLVYSAVIGLVSGAADTSVNVWIIDIWKDKSAAFVQALQFFWALGFIVSPLISNPFLTEESKEASIKIRTTTTTSSSLLPNYSTNKNLIGFETAKGILPSDEHFKLVQESKLYIPFVVAGSICLVGSVSLLVIYLYRRVERCALKNKLKEEENQENSKSNANNVIKEDEKANDDFEDHPSIDYSKKKLYLIQILLYTCIMTSAFCASEMTTFQYVCTFAFMLGHTKNVASLMMTAVAVSFAIGRFCGILCAIKYKPIYILIFDFAIILIGNLILLASKSGIQFLWIGLICIGIGYASFFAAIFSYLRDRILVNNLMSSVVILSSLSGNAIGYPIFIGKYIEAMPLIMIYGNLFCLFLMFVCFIGLLSLDCKFGIKSSIIRKLKESQTHELIGK